MLFFNDAAHLRAWQSEGWPRQQGGGLDGGAGAGAQPAHLRAEDGDRLRAPGAGGGATTFRRLGAARSVLVPGVAPDARSTANENLRVSPPKDRAAAYPPSDRRTPGSWRRASTTKRADAQSRPRVRAVSPLSGHYDPRAPPWAPGPDGRRSRQGPSRRPALPPTTQDQAVWASGSPPARARAWSRPQRRDTR